MIRGPANKTTGKASLLHPIERTAATVIIADGANKGDVMPEIACVPGEVERRATQVLGSGKDVPEEFTDGDDFHEERVSR